MTETDLAGIAHEHIEPEHGDVQDQGNHQRLEQAVRHRQCRKNCKHHKQDDGESQLATARQPDYGAMDAALVADIAPARWTAREQTGRPQHQNGEQQRQR